MGKYAQIMATGGMADDGLERDPKSGNEIPPGALADEVSDQIDAKLSEGEYVFDAATTQYYGLDKLEKMRDKAHAALGDMEQRGRIGGEPAEGGAEVEDEDDLPFGDEELMVAATGGMAGRPRGFAGGGQVAAYNPPMTFGGSTPSYGGGQAGGTRTETYVNAQGQTLNVLFINGQPSKPIPAGFYPRGKVPAQAKADADIQKGLISQGGEGQERYADSQLTSGEASGVQREKEDLTKLSLEEIGKKATFGDLAGKGLKLAGLALPGVGMVIGAVGSQILGAQNRELIAEIDRRLAAEGLSEADKKNLETYKAKIADDVGGLIGKGIQALTDILDPKEKAAAQEAAITQTVDSISSDIHTGGSSTLDDLEATGYGGTFDKVGGGYSQYDTDPTQGFTYNTSDYENQSDRDSYDNSTVSGTGYDRDDYSVSDGSTSTSGTGGTGSMSNTGYSGKDPGGTGYGAGQDADYGYKKGGLVKKRKKK